MTGATETVLTETTPWGLTRKVYPNRVCQDCTHYEQGVCAKGDKSVTGPEARTCYRYVTDATLRRRLDAPLPKGLCAKCHTYCDGDCEAANA